MHVVCNVRLLPPPLQYCLYLQCPLVPNTHHRPIAGYVNFCPSAFTSDASDDFIFDVAKHEIHHALVMNIYCVEYMSKKSPIRVLTISTFQIHFPETC